MILLNFSNYKTVKHIRIKNELVLFSDEEAYLGSATEKDGLYEILNEHMIAVFSDRDKNYLYLKNHLYELNPTMSIEYFIAQSEGGVSWFKIRQEERIVFSLQYINPRGPFVLPDPFFPDEDYETTNFAYHLAQYIKKVHENPKTILFP